LSLETSCCWEIEEESIEATTKGESFTERTSDSAPAMIVSWFRRGEVREEIPNEREEVGVGVEGGCWFILGIVRRIREAARSPIELMGGNASL